MYHVPKVGKPEKCKCFRSGQLYQKYRMGHNLYWETDFDGKKTLRWPNTVFLYLCVIYRYFQTTGSWAAKIGKVQFQLKKIVF